MSIFTEFFPIMGSHSGLGSQGLWLYRPSDTPAGPMAPARHRRAPHDSAPHASTRGAAHALINGAPLLIGAALPLYARELLVADLRAIALALGVPVAGWRRASAASAGLRSLHRRVLIGIQLGRLRSGGVFSGPSGRACGC